MKHETIPNVYFSSRLDVYNAQTEAYVRTYNKGKIGRFNELCKNEFFTFTLLVQNDGASDFTFSEIYVCVDDGVRWEWMADVVPAGTESVYHIFHCNMKSLSLGAHRAKWFVDGKMIHSDSFVLSRDLDWNRETKLPRDYQIQLYTNPKNLRSPYVSIWMDIPHGTRYKEYVVDFKADHLPRGTYCALGNWCMDYAGLRSKFQKTELQGISAYAGFQSSCTGRKMGIMSFWDVHCTDFDGKKSTLRAKILYPEQPHRAGQFDNEGVGVQCIDSYPWRAKHWYRMHLRCCDSPEGTTLVEMWAADLQTGAYTLISRYDSCVPNSAFLGPMCVFLENFDESHAGEIRTLEISNVRYLDEKTGKWCDVHSGKFYINGTEVITDYEGSYDFGVKDGRLWIMTTGLVGFGSLHKDFHVDWGK